MDSDVRRASGLTSFIVIPARLESTRLPRKLLLRQTGKSLLQHTYEAARRAVRPSGICVAADHKEIAEEVLRFGGRVKMTDPRAKCGTDRVAEVAAKLDGDIDVVVNVQGDEPELSGDAIDLVVELLADHPHAVMSTLATPIRSLPQLADPSCVKVVFDDSGQALYFSRSPIPYVRQQQTGVLFSDPTPHFFQHVGLYAYRRDFLSRFAHMPPSRLEQMENLEQLRALASGYRIQVGVVDEPTVGIDTPEDYDSFVRRTLLAKSA